MAELSVVKVPVKPNDLLFICLDGADAVDVDDLRNHFELTYPGVKAIFLNYNVRVRKSNVRGIRKLSVKYAAEIPDEGVERLKGMVADSIQAINGRKSRYSIIKEG